MKTRILLLTLALFLALPAATLAQFTYTTSDNQITITGYTGPGGAVIIPSTIDGVPVTWIEDGAFYFCSSLTSVTIPNSVTSIGYSAFNFCTALTNVNLPSGLGSIEDTTFWACTSLRSVVIPDAVTRIGYGAFNQCWNLRSVKLPNRLVSIGANAFESCFELTTIVVPNSVTNIEEEAFLHCGGLTNITLGNGLTEISRQMLAGCGSLLKLIIPKSVSHIAEGAFFHCRSLTGIYFEGDAPSMTGGFTFPCPDQCDVPESSTIIYHLPGATGWGSTFGGRPVMRWLPKMQNAATTIHEGQFGFTINWASDQNLIIEATADLSSPVWTVIETKRLVSDLTLFSDPDWAKYPSRVYRLRSP